MPTSKIPFPSYRGTEPYAFVTYAHRDSAIVFPELERLNRMGVKVWYDEGIDPGTEEWPKEIETALLKAECLVYFVTAQSVESLHCRREFHLADNRKMKIIPVFLEATELKDGLDLQMSARQAIYAYRMPAELYEQKLAGVLAVAPTAHPAPLARPSRNRNWLLAAGGVAALLALLLSLYLLVWRKDGETPLRSDLATPALTGKSPILQSDPMVDARFQAAAKEIEAAMQSVLNNVDSGALTADAGEGEIRALRRRLQKESEKAGQNAVTQTYYEKVDTALAKAPVDYADIFAYRRVEEAFQRLETSNDLNFPGERIRALSAIKELIDFFAAVIEAIRGDDHKLDRLAKAVQRMDKVKRQYTTLATAALAQQNTTRPITPRPAAAAPAQPASPPLPTGRRVMGAGIRCPYAGCPSGGEYLHYANGNRVPAGTRLNCQRCGKPFLAPP